MTSFFLEMSGLPITHFTFFFLLTESHVISTNQIPQVEQGAEPEKATAVETVAAEPEVCCSPSQHASLFHCAYSLFTNQVN